MHVSTLILPLRVCQWGYTWGISHLGCRWKHKIFLYSQKTFPKEGRNVINAKVYEETTIRKGKIISLTITNTSVGFIKTKEIQNALMEVTLVVEGQDVRPLMTFLFKERSQPLTWGWTKEWVWSQQGCP